MASYKDCGKEGCECCKRVMQLLSKEDALDVVTQDYLAGTKFREGKLPVETAMCDNVKCWGNFSINELGIISNVCLPHGTG